MSIKISFMHYRNYITWTRVKSPLVFEEFDLVYPFVALLFFSLSLSIYKNVNLSNYPPQHPWFLRACNKLDSLSFSSSLTETI